MNCAMSVHLGWNGGSGASIRKLRYPPPFAEVAITSTYICRHAQVPARMMLSRAFARDGLGCLS